MNTLSNASPGPRARGAAPLARVIERRYGGRDLPLALVLPDGGRVALSEAPEVDVIARSWRGLKALASPALGALARAYVHNDIDFTGTARRVLAIAEAMVGDVAHGRDPFRTKLRHFVHQRRGNRANIRHHYDVSNAFYRLFLDERMVYSCAYFRASDESLEQAQANKLDHICRKLRLKAGERFLDIGCGWGALVIWAAKHYGVRAHGITLSERQLELARERIAAEGLEDRVTVELRDYRALEGEGVYDKVSSVGMFEHVGLANLPVYHATVHRVLKPNGLFLNHGISHEEEGWHRDSVDSAFINRYVFPDGELDMVSNVQRSMERAHFEIQDVENLRPHYALTLRHWVQRIEQRHEEALKHVSEATYRVWRLYMAASAMEFESGGTAIYQILASRRPDARPYGSPVPLTRGDLYDSEKSC